MARYWILPPPPDDCPNVRIEELKGQVQTLTDLLNTKQHELAIKLHYIEALERKIRDRFVAAYREGLEYAARVCDDMHAREDDNCGEAAAAIRALKGEKE